jgi:hypothetical protein
VGEGEGLVGMLHSKAKKTISITINCCNLEHPLETTTMCKNQARDWETNASHFIETVLRVTY